MSYLLAVRPTYIARTVDKVATTNSIADGLTFASEEEALRVKRKLGLSTNWEVVHIDDALMREAERHRKLANELEDT